MSTAIKYLRNALEAVLAGRIPDLQLEDLLLEFHQERAKFDADCDFMVLHKLVVRQPVQHAGFADR